MKELFFFSNVLKQNSFVGNFLVFSLLIQMNVFPNVFCSPTAYYDIILNFDIKTDTFTCYTLFCTAYLCFTNSFLKMSTAWNMPKCRLSATVFSRIWTESYPHFYVFGHNLRFYPNTEKYDSIPIRENTYRRKPVFDISHALINYSVT